MVAIFKHILKQKESTENQGRELSSIFQSIDAGTHGLIEFPMTSDTDSQTQVTSIQKSIALACLLNKILVKIIHQLKDNCNRFKHIQSNFQQHKT